MRSQLVARILAGATIVTTAALMGFGLPSQAASQPRAQIGGSQAGEASVAAIDGRSGTDVWAVGSAGAVGDPQQTAAWHWDGHSWTASPSLSPCTYINYLDGVAEVSPTDVWAVGFCSDHAGHGKTLLEHFDGTSWHRLASPNPSSENLLSAVSALSAGDVWVTGYSLQQPSGSIVEHWDGSSWTSVAVPNAWLTSIEALAPNNVWAVDTRDFRHTQAFHYDGSTWTPVGTVDQPVGIGASGPSDIWAVGDSGTKHPTSAAAQFDGSTWKSTAVPHVKGRTGQGLDAVSADSPTDAWAIGATKFARSQHGFVAHWDGTTWTIAQKPDTYGSFNTVLGFGANDAWVAGPIQDHAPLVNIEHWNGTTWKRYTLS